MCFRKIIVFSRQTYPASLWAILCGFGGIVLFHAVSPGASKPAINSFSNDPPLELGENPQQHRLARRGRCIEPLLKQEQADSIGLWG
jgi:hypothetical protein